MRLRWSRGSVLPLRTQVYGFKPIRSRQDFSWRKVLSTPSFGGEVKPSLSCRRFAACKRSANVTCKSAFRQNYRPTFSPTVPSFAARISHVVWTWRHLAAEVGMSKPPWGGSGLHNKPYRLRCISSICSRPWWRRRTLNNTVHAEQLQHIKGPCTKSQRNGNRIRVTSVVKMLSGVPVSCYLHTHLLTKIMTEEDGETLYSSSNAKLTCYSSDPQKITW
jgi:hypothetical protein